MSAQRTLHALVLVVFALLPAVQASAQSIAIGRSALTLPDRPQWTVESLPVTIQNYSGPQSGKFEVEGKRMTLKSSSGATKAVMVSRVSESVSIPGSMQWSSSCKGPDNPAIYQSDRSNANDIDCLKVFSINNTPEAFDKFPRVKADMAGNRPEGKVLYYVIFSHSLGVGGIAQSQVLVAPDFKGREGSSINNPSRLPTAVIAWAEALAKSNRDAIGSIRGNWSVPEMSFTQ